MKKFMDNRDNFFDDILNDDESLFNNEPHIENDEDDTEFSFEDDEDEIIKEKVEEKPKKINKKDKEYKRTKTEVQQSVEELQGSINSMLETIKVKPEDMYADKDLLPGLDIQIENHDYDKDIELIKIESKETLECLANLYLNEEQMKTKNIYKIIKDDSMALSKLNFSIDSTQRALISCLRQIDLGVNDPLMYQSVALFQKEMRDSIKMAYDLQKKMKDFYNELKGELQDINAGTETYTDDPEDNYTIVGDPKMLNDLFDKMKDDPQFLNNMLKKH
jgi:hypothetical protein